MFTPVQKSNMYGVKEVWTYETKKNSAKRKRNDANETTQMEKLELLWQ